MNRFTKLNILCKPVEGTEECVSVLDNRSGLIWLQRSIAVENHAAAETAVAALEPVDGEGWRVPTCEELQQLVDRTRRNPAIDTDAFPDTRSDWYWSSSPVAGDPDYAWSVYFYLGDSNWNGRCDDGFVRAVRGPVLAGQ